MDVDFKFTFLFFGDSTRGDDLKKSLEKLIERAGKICEVEMVDLSIHPEAAAQYRVLAAPMLVRTHPLPIRKVIGYLTDLEQVVLVFGIEFIKFID